MIGLIGKKIGMTQIFSPEGAFIPVSVIEAGPCPVMKSTDKSIQLGYGQVNAKRVSAPLLGVFKKLGIEPKAVIREVRVTNPQDYKVGEELKVDIFKEGDFVDVIGTSLGKGFAGGMKRWHWSGGPQTHGHTSHRRVGSVGSTTTPGRIFRGHTMPGHMGNARVTVQNLRVVKVDGVNNVLVVRGAVPGHKNGYLIIRKAIKTRSKNEVKK